jgi:CDP-diacylglycerol---serine O-phosphatidyltransferase
MSAEIKKRRPRKRRWRRFRERDGKPYRGTYIVPNLFTTANLFAGFFGIINAINGKFELAATAILFSCLFDILDGKVARLTKATSRFGVEYDSLADLVAFGLGPGLLVYLWALRPFGRLGWLAAFVFVACGALRLARFNVQVGTVNSKYFVGLPIPGAATMLATTVLFLDGWEILSPHLLGVPLLVCTYLLGFLMVSTIPFNSFKDLEFVKSKPLPVLFLVIVLVTVVAMSPGPMMFTLLLTYVISGPLEYLLKRYRTLKSGQETESGRAITYEQTQPDEVTRP